MREGQEKKTKISMTSNTTIHKCPTQGLIRHQAEIKIHLGKTERCRTLTNRIKRQKLDSKNTYLVFPHVNTTKSYNQKNL